jgi:hypothetical protein
MTANDYDALVAEIRESARNRGPHAVAGVEALIWAGWLRRDDFDSAAVRYIAHGQRFIDWSAARTAFGSCFSNHEVEPMLGPASSSAMTILDAAITAGEKRFNTSGLGDEHAKAFATIFASMVGLKVVTPEAVTISRAEFDRLTKADEELGALHAAGVDNWEGYDEAVRS